MSSQVHCGICSVTYLIKSDLLVVPVLDVEEQNHAAVFVSAGQDAGVAGLDGAANGLWGQILKQLGVILPETHVTWMEKTDTHSWVTPGCKYPCLSSYWNHSFHLKVFNT